MATSIIRYLFLAILFLGISTQLFSAQKRDTKREFRGAWIQAVNGQFSGMDESQMKGYLTDMLNNLQRANVNAIIFQVRVEGDALYESRHEPWTRFITGRQGVSPGWDPLAFMVNEAHKRNMELHAWINPYRARTKGTLDVASNHQSLLHPERFLRYDNQLFFDPALQENRDFICTIIKDIISRYDVDGLHIDDYFYPYPVKGRALNDDASFNASPRGFTNKGDWRRDNINKLILQMHNTIRTTKPWVKFGVSPFGIYRNIKSSPMGSNTNGLQCYDDLYADVLLWVNKGWVDYCIPQVYWEIGHSAADYETLVKWWAKHAKNRPLYIGQDVNRTVRANDPTNPNRHQLPKKMELQRAENNVHGSCLWDASSAANNVGRYRDALAQYYHQTPALMPLSPFIDKDEPSKVKGVKKINTPDGQVLVWLTDKDKKPDPMNEAKSFVVYRFAAKQKVDTDNPANIVAITSQPFYRLPVGEKGKFTYVVTALDRIQNESKGVKCKVKF